MPKLDELTDTWAETGVVKHGIKLDVVDTDSHADSLLQKLSVGGVEKYAVGKDGEITSNGARIPAFVDTPASLTGLASAVHGMAYATRGRRTVGDGGANTYYYDSGSSATCDGGFVLDGIGGSNAPGDTAATYAGTGSGRFIAVDQSIANLKQFGAAGDGSTDDSFRLQAALDSALAAQEGFGHFTVLVPPASPSYKIDNDINLKANVKITGTGTLRLASTAKLISIIDYWEISGITIQGADAAGTYGIFIHEASQSFIIDDVLFQDLDYSIWITRSWSFWITRNQFRNTSHQATAGIYITNGSGTNPEGGTYGPVNAATCNDNQFHASGAGRVRGLWLGDEINHGGLGSYHINKISLSHNKYEGCDFGIHLAEINVCQIFSSYFETCGEGILAVGNASRGLSIVGNFFSGSTGSGFFDPAINLKPSSTSLSENSGYVIRGNVFKSCTQAVLGNAQVRSVTLDSNIHTLPDGTEYSFDGNTNVTRWNDLQKGNWSSSIIPSDPPSGNYDVEAYQSGATLVNTDFTANQFWNLPPAVAGLEYRFANTNASGFDLQVLIDGTDTIMHSNTSYTRINLTLQGHYVHLVCLKDGQWFTTQQIGATFVV